jgi:hypothetical protein
LTITKKGSGVLCQGATVKYAWIKQHKTEFPVGSMCRFMRVSRSAYYSWLHRIPTTGEKDDAELAGIIQTLFAKRAVPLLAPDVSK